MTDLITKQFDSKDVRIVLKDGEPWWVAKDVCDVLEHSNSRMALSNLDEDEKGVSNVYTLGGEQEMCVISESGLYRLIMLSRKKEAKPFQRWVTHEVLPEIRRTGGYCLPKTLPEALRALADQTEAVQRIEAERKRLELENEKLNPLAQLYKNLVDTEGLFSWSEASKVLSNQYPGMGRNRLTSILRENGYLMVGKVEPYQRYVEQGLFKVKLLTYKDNDGLERTVTVTCCTQKGIDKISQLLSGQEIKEPITDGKPLSIENVSGDIIEQLIEKIISEETQFQR